jgi:hypothetical protein
MSPSEIALVCLLRDVEAARAHQQRGKGGQQCGGPPVFWGLGPSALNAISRECCHGFGLYHSPESIAAILARADLAG